jgi:hypothetical protein
MPPAAPCHASPTTWTRSRAGSVPAKRLAEDPLPSSSGARARLGRQLEQPVSTDGVCADGADGLRCTSLAPEPCTSGVRTVHVEPRRLRQHWVGICLQYCPVCELMVPLPISITQRLLDALSMLHCRSVDAYTRLGLSMECTAYCKGYRTLRHCELKMADHTGSEGCFPDRNVPYGL